MNSFIKTSCDPTKKANNPKVKNHWSKPNDIKKDKSDHHAKPIIHKKFHESRINKKFTQK